MTEGEGGGWRFEHKSVMWLVCGVGFFEIVVCCIDGVENNFFALIPVSEKAAMYPEWFWHLSSLESQILILNEWETKFFKGASLHHKVFQCQR